MLHPCPGLLDPLDRRSAYQLDATGIRAWFTPTKAVDFPQALRCERWDSQRGAFYLSLQEAGDDCSAGVLCKAICCAPPSAEDVLPASCPMGILLSDVALAFSEAWVGKSWDPVTGSALLPLVRMLILQLTETPRSCTVATFI